MRGAVVDGGVRDRMWRERRGAVGTQGSESGPDPLASRCPSRTLAESPGLSVWFPSHTVKGLGRRYASSSLPQTFCGPPVSFLFAAPPSFFFTDCKTGVG